MDITDLDKYTRGEVDAKLATKSETIHGHTELHSHINKALLDTITQTLIDTWNTVTDKSDKTHNHDDAYYTESEINTLLLNKSETSHNHDGAYYKQAEVDAKLSNKANNLHQHAEADITDLDKYTKAEVDTKLEGKSDATHTHSTLHSHINKPILDKLTETIALESYDLYNLKYIDDIRNGYTEGHTHSNLGVLNKLDYTGLSESIDLKLIEYIPDKADKGHTHTKEDVSDFTHVHAEADITDLDKYTKAEIDTKLEGKSDVGHKHTEADVTDLDKYTKAEVDSKLGAKTDKTTTSYHTNNDDIHVTLIDKANWNSKAEGTHNHDDKYYTEAEVDAKLDGKANTSHTHNYITVGTVKPTDGSMWYEVIG